MGGENYSGYIAELAYTKGVYPELSPVEIDFVLTQRGVAVPGEPNDQKRYCELGCGHGYTTVLLAAMDPETEYVGIDINPTHIASAKDLARKAGIENVRFMECSFKDALEQELGPFDWIVLNGVVSWVSEAVESQIGQFIKAFLRPGGRVFVSYNAMPGKSQLEPLRWMLSFFADRETSELPLEEKAQGALEQVMELFKRNAILFPQNGRLARATRRLSQKPVNYLAHEYLHECWRCLYFIEVARRFCDLGLSFVGSLKYQENVDEYRFTMPMLSHLNTFKDGLVREQVADLYRNTAFRKDVYCNEVQMLTSKDRLEAWRNTYFGLIRPLDKMSSEWTIPSGKVSLDRPVFWATVESLKKGPRKLAHVEAEVGRPVDELIRMAIHPLLATNQVKPVTASPKGGRTVKDLNAVLMRMAVDEAKARALSTEYGIALHVPLFEQAYLAIRNGGNGKADDEVAASVMDTLQRAERGLVDEAGNPIQDEGKAFDRLQVVLEEFEITKRSLYQTLGIIK